MTFKRVIIIPSWQNENDWRQAVKKLLDKLGAKYSKDDEYKFDNTEKDWEIPVEYDDADTDAILDSMNACDYLMSRQA